MVSKILESVGQIFMLTLIMGMPVLAGVEYFKASFSVFTTVTAISWLLVCALVWFTFVGLIVTNKIEN